MSEPQSVALELAADGDSTEAMHGRSGASTRAAAGEVNLVRRGAVSVIVFWWVATGLIIAMQRSGPTRIAALFVATLLATLGLYELIASRDDASALGARRSFLGGAMLWGWVSVTFYGGFLTGFIPVGEALAAPSWGAVPSAIEATLLSDAAALILMGIAAAIVRPGVNHTGVWALAIFWAVQQVAKINVFLGVENPAGNFLPPHLAHLQRFFGPPVNSSFLYSSMGALALLTIWCGWRVRSATTAGARQAGVLYATILALAVLEIAVLGMRLETTPWDAFLRARGG